MAANRSQARTKRAMRVRRKLRNTGVPRLSVFRSNTNTYAQIIDDASGKTLAQANSLESSASGDSKTDAARKVGELVGQRATAAGVSDVVFDRGGNRFTGRIKAVADGARDSGLNF